MNLFPNLSIWIFLFWLTFRFDKFGQDFEANKTPQQVTKPPNTKYSVFNTHTPNTTSPNTKYTSPTPTYKLQPLNTKYNPQIQNKTPTYQIQPPNTKNNPKIPKATPKYQNSHTQIQNTHP